MASDRVKPSAAPEPAVGFEGRQTARPGRLQAPFWGYPWGACHVPNQRQKGLRPQRQGAVAIPAGPTAHRSRLALARWSVESARHRGVIVFFSGKVPGGLTEGNEQFYAFGSHNTALYAASQCIL